MVNSPDRLVMSEKQLKAASIQQAQNDIRIIQDCTKILQETTKAATFFTRLDLFEEKLNHLKVIQPYVKLNIPFLKMETAYQNEKVEIVQQFLERYFSTFIEKMNKAKTEKGKKNQIQKFYDSLQEYYPVMSVENIDYIEAKYRGYSS